MWKVGLRSFRAARYDEVTQLFERAAVDFPRSDYRPAWLFWAGRAHELRGRSEQAEARYTLAVSRRLRNTLAVDAAIERNRRSSWSSRTEEPAVDPRLCQGKGI